LVLTSAVHHLIFAQILLQAWSGIGFCMCKRRSSGTVYVLVGQLNAAGSSAERHSTDGLSPAVLVPWPCREKLPCVHADLQPHEHLHELDGDVGLLPHVRAPHDGLKFHQASQGTERLPRLIKRTRLSTTMCSRLLVLRGNDSRTEPQVKCVPGDRGNAPGWWRPRHARCWRIHGRQLHR
jgi:hypothetical protein